MLAGLEEFKASSAETKAKKLAAFMLVAGRIAKGEDVPAKAISTAVTGAEKTPEDLLAEIEIAKELLAEIDVIEQSRRVFETFEGKIPVRVEAMAAIKRKEDAICEQIADVEADRYHFAAELADSTQSLKEAKAAEEKARRAINGAEVYGIRIPDPLPPYPNMPGTHMALQRKEFDRLCLGRVVGRIHDIRMAKRPTAPVVEAVVQPEFETLQAPDPVPSPSPAPEPVADPQSIADSFLSP